MTTYTQIEIENRRLEIQEAAERRAVTEQDALKNERSARLDLYREQVRAMTQQAENNRQMAEASKWVSRVGLILDAAIKRLDDRTSPTGAAKIPNAVTEAMDTLAEIERRLPPPEAPPPATEPPPPVVGGLS